MIRTLITLPNDHTHQVSAIVTKLLSNNSNFPSENVTVDNRCIPFGKLGMLVVSPGTGGVLTSVLLPDTLEDPGSFTTFKIFHGAAKDWLQQPQ